MLVPTQQFPTLNIRWWGVKDKLGRGGFGLQKRDQIEEVVAASDVLPLKINLVILSAEEFATAKSSQSKDPCAHHVCLG
jgi:hypothetical protein